jgi:hypothetical protein
MRRQIVEPLWSRADATDGNDRQRRCRPKSLSYLRSLADDCHQLRPPLYGKEGVDGSSPSVGSAKARIAGRSFRHELARPQLLRYGAVDGAPRAVHHARRGDARHRDARAILLGVLEHTLAVPLGREAECVRVSVLDTRALQVSDVDELRAALIAAAAVANACSSRPTSEAVGHRKRSDAGHGKPAYGWPHTSRARVSAGSISSVMTLNRTGPACIRRGRPGTLGCGARRDPA